MRIPPALSSLDRRAVARWSFASLLCLVSLWLLYVHLVPSYSVDWRPERSTLFVYLPRTRLPSERLLSGAALAALLLLALAPARDEAPSTPRRRATRYGSVALAAFALFYTARDKVSSLGDGRALLRDPVSSVEAGRNYAFLDELVGMWLPLRVARALHTALSWRGREAIQWGYAYVAFASGVGFCLVLAALLPRVRRPRALATLLLVNAATLFFCGYVENYGLASTLVACGLLPALLALRAGECGPRHVFVATACCSAAVACHAVTCWSVFALVALAFAAVPPWRAGLKRFAATAAGGLAIAGGVLGAIYLLFSKWITPGVQSVHGNGRSILSRAEMFVHRPPAEHTLAILRVALPAVVVLAAALLVAPARTLRRLVRADALVALALFAGFMVHQLIWRSGYNTYTDWDLFGFTWFPLAYLAHAAYESTDPPPWTEGALFALCVLGGLGWPLFFARM